MVKIKWSKVVAVLVVCISIVSGTVLVHTSFAQDSIKDINKDEVSYTYEYQTVIVQTGDTLWDIAAKHYPNSIDPRKAIEQIKKINELSSAELHQGQIIKVPHFENN